MMSKTSIEGRSTEVKNKKHLNMEKMLQISYVLTLKKNLICHGSKRITTDELPKKITESKTREKMNCALLRNRTST